MRVEVTRVLACIIAVECLAMTLSGCGGAAAPPSQHIVLTDGKVVVEQGTGVVIIKKEVSKLPGVGFKQEEGEVEIYRDDVFADPRTDNSLPSNPLHTLRVSRDGTLLEDLQLTEGRYTAVARNIHVVQDGKEFRSDLTAYVFDVFAVGDTLRTTLPIEFKAKFPALGAVIEDSYVAFRTDAGAVNGTSRLFVKHANGTIDMTRTFAKEESDNPVAQVSFEALPGGPTLGNVSRLILKAFKP